MVYPMGIFVRADKLERGSRVCSSESEGAVLSVASVCVHEESEQEFMDLRTCSAALTVTISHRVMVQKGDKWQTQPAGSLHPGDHVVVGGRRRVEELTEARKFTACESVVDIEFCPDKPVEAFPPPPSDTILSKGHGWPRTRRGRNRPCESGDTCSVRTDDDVTFPQYKPPEKP